MHTNVKFLLKICQSITPLHTLSWRVSIGSWLYNSACETVCGGHFKQRRVSILDSTFF